MPRGSALWRTTRPGVCPSKWKASPWLCIASLTTSLHLSTWHCPTPPATPPPRRHPALAKEPPGSPCPRVPTSGLAAARVVCTQQSPAFSSSATGSDRVSLCSTLQWLALHSTHDPVPTSWPDIRVPIPYSPASFLGTVCPPARTRLWSLLPPTHGLLTPPTQLSFPLRRFPVQLPTSAGRRPEAPRSLSAPIWGPSSLG